MTPEALQVLRTIDKTDRVGLDGVRALFGDGLADRSGARIDGCGLHPLQIEIVMQYLQIDANDPLPAIRDLFSRIERRFAVIEMLERGIGETAWDRLIAMPTNSDQTWSDQGRPRNIGWALDDIFFMMTAEDGI